jgi:hypothetical protein
MRSRQSAQNMADAKNAKDGGQASSACPEECITRSVILIMNELTAKFMASIGFVFNNLVISMNLFRFQHFESYQCRSPKQNNFGVNLAPVR